MQRDPTKRLSNVTIPQNHLGSLKNMDAFTPTSPALSVSWI